VKIYRVNDAARVCVNWWQNIIVKLTNTGKVSIKSTCYFIVVSNDFAILACNTTNTMPFGNTANNEFIE